MVMAPVTSREIVLVEDDNPAAVIQLLLVILLLLNSRVDNSMPSYTLPRHT